MYAYIVLFLNLIYAQSKALYSHSLIHTHNAQTRITLLVEG